MFGKLIAKHNISSYRIVSYHTLNMYVYLLTQSWFTGGSPSGTKYFGIAIIKSWLCRLYHILRRH